MFKKLFICFIPLYLYILFLSQNYLLHYGDQLKGILNVTNDSVVRPESIEIWCKAHIGLYLWKHLLETSTKLIDHGFYEIGHANLMGMNFVFRRGPGYIQTTVPQTVQYLILILNGRSEGNVKKSLEWLNYLSHLKQLRRTAVILLGNEQCRNEWILQHLKSRGGLVDVLFVVYDWKLVDNKEIFQWPLGVASYRGFSKVEPSRSLIYKRRPFKCNFVGTVYANSSRESLKSILKANKAQKACYVSTRSSWTPEETEHSLNEYTKALLSSDLTLSPVGKNTECYRIYEALSLGSVPVVEDVMTPGECDSPLRLLKEYNAPFIYVKNWTNIRSLIRKDKLLKENVIQERREKVVYWYKYFKYSVGAKFLRTIRQTFF